MIGFLRGKVLDHQDGKLLLGIGGTPDPVSASSMIGYLVSVPQSAEYGAWQNGKTVEVHVHTHVREDALDLYGFGSRVEKDLFLALLTVNGIGPKGALSILSSVPAAQLVDCVLRGDKDSLTKIPGVGKKTAERLVLELADPFRKKLEAGLLGELPSAGRGAGPKSGASFRDPSSSSRSETVAAREALVGLGYREQDIQGLLNELFTELETRNGVEPRAEELIRGALQRLA